MTIITSYDWESDSFIHHADNAACKAWREAVAAIAATAHEKLPECRSHIDAAVKIVLAGDVELLPDGTATVASQSHGGTAYQVVNGACTCKDFAKAPHSLCKHRLSAAIARRAHELVQAQRNGTHHGQGTAAPAPGHAAAAPDAPAPAPAETPGVPEGLKPYVVSLHGKPFIRYVGLLTLAHARGLVQLTARIEFHAEALVLASASATFSDGRVFTEWGDATPENVGVQVRPHWVRMALTRAKARCLCAVKAASLNLSQFVEGQSDQNT
jgi:hypothetical protein